MEQIEKDSLKFIKKMLGKELTTDEKYLGMMELDQRYPNIGFYNAAQRFAEKWLKPKSSERLPYKD